MYDALIVQRCENIKNNYVGKKITMQESKDNKSLIDKIDDWCRKRVFFSGIIISLISSLILLIIGASTANSITNKIDVGNQNLQEDFSCEIATLSENISQIISNEVDLAVTQKLGDLNIQNGSTNTTNIYINSSDIMDPDTILRKAIQSSYSNENDIISASGKCQFPDKTMPLFTDEAGREYTVEDIQNKTFVVYYTENGEDVFFKGQYDENGYWDGNCIINRYLNGKLILIMDAEYESGNLISYRQVFSCQKTYLDSNYDVWTVSERKIEGNISTGFTNTYFKTADINQLFNTDYVAYNDIINVDDFMMQNQLLQEGYYNGYTSNGKYNDTTGNAYLVKYSEDGFIRFLYVGNISDGQPADNTGNAWAIALGHDQITYYYYKGIFIDGQIDGDWEKYTIDEIKEIVNPNDFDCSINWLEMNNN